MDGERILAAVLAWLATYAVHGAVLCAAAWALGPVLARFIHGRARLAAARERLWKLAIFGGLATATLTTAGAGAWRLRIAVAQDPPAFEAAADAPPTPLPDSAATEIPGPSTPLAPVVPVDWMHVAAGVWLVGMALGAAGWLRDRRRLARRLRGRVRAGPGPASWILADLRRRGTSANPILWVAPGLSSPISLGILRPSICIPPHAGTGLMREELEAMLAHELAHVARRDALLLALCRTVEVVFFFQPLLRWARARLIDEIEIGCDEQAAEWTGDPAALASCLTEVATWIVAGRPYEAVLAMAARGSRLEQRVHGLLDEARRSPGPEGGIRFAPVTWVLGIMPLAVGGIALDAGRAEPLPPAAAQAPVDSTVDTLEDSARELVELLDLLESDYAALASDPRLASAPAGTRERAATIEKGIQSLRATSAQLDALLTEGP